MPRIGHPIAESTPKAVLYLGSDGIAAKTMAVAALHLTVLVVVTTPQQHSAKKGPRAGRQFLLRAICEKT